MFIQLPCRALLGVLIAALLYADPAAAQYSVVDLGDLGGGRSVATSINARGQVAGVSLRADHSAAAFIWQNGVMTDLGSLGGRYSIAYALNNRGQVVGFSQREDSSFGAFIWQDGVMSDLGGATSFAVGINERGQIVGQAYAADLSSSSAVLWWKGVMTELPGLGGSYAVAVGVNARGQIVGQAKNADGDYLAVMWENGQITDLGTLGGSNSVAYSVNAGGVACGFSTLVTGELRAAVYAGGDVVDLGTLGGSVSQCLLGINNRGEFVGASTIADDAETHAFVTVDGVMTDLNPQIPADSGWLLVAAYGLNERGQIVGGGTRNAVTRAFLLDRQHGDGQRR